MEKMYRIFLFSAFMLISAGLAAQTTALDFSQADCDGNQHHLFSELDQGKVVVLNFVMMNCASCVTASKALNNIVNEYNQTHPGRVLFYSMGYLNAYTCSQMTAWRNAAGLAHPVFTGGQAQTAFYGGMGMPTIVVLANNTHDVLFKKLGYATSDNSSIRAAIDQGLLYNPSGLDDGAYEESLRVFPTLSDGFLNVILNKPSSGSIVLLDAHGRTLETTDFGNTGMLQLDISARTPGLYYIQTRIQGNLPKTVKIIRY